MYQGARRQPCSPRLATDLYRPLESMRTVEALHAHADITHVCRACSPHRCFGSKAHEGAVVKSELVAMWKLKTTAMRAKLGNDERVVAAQLDALAAAPVPPSRAQPARTAKVIEQVRASGGGQTPNELLLELERQMVEAER